MSIPKEPRQIMINLMYLVLTAMLALNISNEILHAFKILNAGIVKSNQSIASKNSDMMRDFDANENMEGHRDRVKPFNDKAKEVHAASDKLVEYLEGWKTKIIDKSGGYASGKESKQIKNEANIDASTYMLVEKKGGDEIKAKLQEFRDFILARIDDPAVRSAFDRDLPVQIVNPEKSDANPGGDWSTGTFYHVPTTGVIALMSKMQNDVRSSESIIVGELFKEAEAKPLKFDAIAGLAIPKTSYALVGQEIEANIMVAAYNKSVTPIISSNSGRVSEIKDGIGIWKTVASGLGMQTVRGTISVVNNGQRMTQPWEFQYMVGSAGASLQLDKMNVFYIGVPNPVTVTAAGYSLEDVSLNVPGARLENTGKGKYNIYVTQVGEVNATIMAKTAQGVKQVGGNKIRVKRIPDPVAKINHKTGGGIPANIFRAQLGVSVELENFDFDTRFDMVSFDFSFVQRRKDYQGPFAVNGAYFKNNNDVERYMKMAAVGDRVFIDNIRAKGPDGTVRNLGTISFLLN